MNILDTLKPSQLKLFKKQSYKKGSVLFRENDPCNCVCLLTSGKLNILTYLEDGNEVVYNTIKQNQIFGNNLMFSSDPIYKGNIVALEDSEIISISKDDLLKILSSNHSFLEEYLKHSSDFTKVLNNRIKLLSMQSAQERLYFYLHENGNKINYSSINDLAKQLFLTRETLSRLITRLTKEKRIKKQDNHIEIL